MRGSAAALAALLFLLFGVAEAHGPSGGAETSLPASWSGDLLALAALALSAVCFLLGDWRLRRRLRAGARHHRLRRLLFLAGWLSAALALVSPLDHLSGELFAAHMVQHEILLLVTAPLLILASPGAVFAWSLPRPMRRRTGRLLRPLRIVWQEASRPLPAWALNAVLLWVWHLPVLFQGALTHEGLHWLQHLSFLLAGLLYWQSLFRGEAAYGVAVVSLFTTALHTSGLGALLTFAPYAWYPLYETRAAAWSLTALEDQQLGGLIMWVPGSFLHLLAAIWLLALWLERETPRDRREATKRWP